MKRWIIFPVVWLVGFIAWVIGQKPRYRTEPRRPAFMYTYPDTVERLSERSWRKWQKERRRCRR